MSFQYVMLMLGVCIELNAYVKGFVFIEEARISVQAHGVICKGHVECILTF